MRNLRESVTLFYQPGAGGMASAVEYLGSINWKLNLMLPPTISTVRSVLVKRSHWEDTGTYVPVFPDRPCLDTHATHSMRRERLVNAMPLGTIRECGEGSSHEVVRCDIV